MYIYVLVYVCKYVMPILFRKKMLFDNKMFVNKDPNSNLLTNIWNFTKKMFKNLSYVLLVIIKIRLYC